MAQNRTREISISSGGLPTLTFEVVNNLLSFDDVKKVFPDVVGLLYNNKMQKRFCLIAKREEFHLPQGINEFEVYNPQSQFLLHYKRNCCN